MAFDDCVCGKKEYCTCHQKALVLFPPSLIKAAKEAGINLTEEFPCFTVKPIPKIPREKTNV